MGTNEHDADKKLGILGNTMKTMSVHGVNQATASEIVVFAAHIYCPQYEARVAEYLSRTPVATTS